ncbi:MAG TPA: FAD-binding oxidoreductase [Verrucomicrobiae bacterium]|nr:FAD-binding oxidoreductase [Verrucomicrobiae bacterium]
MRRWNGWGDSAQDYPLTDAARVFLRAHLGEPRPMADAALDTALEQVPASRLEGAGFDTRAETRLRHARAQSFTDWIAMRSGRLGPFPDAVALPTSHEEAAAALATARQRGAIVIPYGGGTSVVGHLAVPVSERPVLSLSLEKLNRVLDVDPRAWTARIGAGTPGPQVEAQLASHGFMLGHFPQSYDYSTVGGWVVTRSSGQQSLRYGRIENLFHAGRLATFKGELRVGGVPASSAGPDLRELVLGSEGRLGVLTEATVRVRPLPESERFHAVFLPDWEHGIAALRALGQSDLALSMLRLSNEVETETQLALAGHAGLVRWLERYLSWRGVGAGKVMMLVGITGNEAQVRGTLGDALALARGHGGVHAGARPGAGWVKNRFRSAYLRNSLWEAGYAVDTMETCLNWPQVTDYMRAVETVARDTFAALGEKVHAYTHLSHVYRQGCSVYSTFLWRASGDAGRELERWARFKAAVSQTIVKHGGTISHQHGVGADHAPYLPAEKGALGMDLIRAAAREFDPDGLMNPGKLFA